jgi:hypothetical protein
MNQRERDRSVQELVPSSGVRRLLRRPCRRGSSRKGGRWSWVWQSPVIAASLFTGGPTWAAWGVRTPGLAALVRRRSTPRPCGRGGMRVCSGRKPKGACGSPNEASQLPDHQSGAKNVAIARAIAGLAVWAPATGQAFQENDLRLANHGRLGRQRRRGRMGG